MEVAMTLMKRASSLPIMDTLLNDLWSTDLRNTDLRNTDKFFGDDFFQRTLLPAVNIKELDTSYEIEMAAPGFSKEDFKIAIERGMLTVSSEKKEEKEEKKPNYTRREFYFNNFSRAFTLPEDVNENGIHAEYKEGVLLLRLDKVNVAAKPAKKVLVE